MDMKIISKRKRIKSNQNMELIFHKILFINSFYYKIEKRGFYIIKLFYTFEKYDIVLDRNTIILQKLI